MKIEVNNPCHEFWANMRPTEKGRFCDACQKEVTDFSKFTDAELKAYFTQNKGAGCGTFRKDQLDRTLANLPTQPFFVSRWWFSFLLLLGACNKESNPKEKNVAQQMDSKGSAVSLLSFFSGKKVTIQGIVQNEFLKRPLGGVEVRIHNTDFVTHTDSLGEFELNVSLPADVQESLMLVFSCPDYDTRSYLLTEKEFNTKKIYYIELEEELLRKGAYGIIENPNKNSLWRGFRSIWFQKKNPNQV